MVGLSGQEKNRLSSHAPGVTEYMTVQYGQMHLPLVEVTAEPFLALLFSISYDRYIVYLLESSKEESISFCT